jgi:hypothetical protein
MEPSPRYSAHSAVCTNRGVRGVTRRAQARGTRGTRTAGVRLGFFFFVGAATAKDAKQKQRYEELRRIAQDATVDRKQLLAATG